MGYECFDLVSPFKGEVRTNIRDQSDLIEHTTLAFVRRTARQHRWSSLPSGRTVNLNARDLGCAWRTQTRRANTLQRR